MGLLVYTRIPSLFSAMLSDTQASESLWEPHWRTSKDCPCLGKRRLSRSCTFVPLFRFGLLMETVKALSSQSGLLLSAAPSFSVLFVAGSPHDIPPGCGRAAAFSPALIVHIVLCALQWSPFCNFLLMRSAARAISAKKCMCVLLPFLLEKCPKAVPNAPSTNCMFLLACVQVNASFFLAL